jgi:hypothetical protein
MDNIADKLINFKDTLGKTYVDAFLNTSPFSLSSLCSKNKSQTIVIWRNLGYLWYSLHDNSFTDVGFFFNRDRTTVRAGAISALSLIETEDRIIINRWKKILEKNNEIILLEEKKKKSFPNIYNTDFKVETAVSNLINSIDNIIFDLQNLQDKSYHLKKLIENP